MRVIRVSRPGSFSGFSRSIRRSRSSGSHGRAAFHADRVLDAAQELDMGAVDLAGAVAEPQQMGRAVVPVAGRRIDAGQRLLIGQEQRLVRGVELGLADLRRGVAR